MNIFPFLSRRSRDHRQPLFFFLLALSLVLNFPLKAQDDPEKENRSMLWKVSGNGLSQPSYLFGTIHLIRDGYLPSDGKVLKAFGEAKAVVVETDTDPAQYTGASRYTNMPGNSLKKLLEEDEYALVEAEVSSYTRQPLSTMDQLKPVSIIMFLTFTYINEVSPQLLQYEGEMIEAFFRAEGRKQDKTIHPLETMEEQFSLLYNSIALDDQADKLVQFVREKEKGLRTWKKIVELYQQEDLQGLYRLMQESPDLLLDEKSMFHDRNAKWMKKLPGWMAEKSTFIAVGAMHLPGDQGLINLLRKEGFTVEPVH